MNLESKNNSNSFNLLRLSEYKKEFLNKLDQNCIQTFKSLHSEVKELEQNIKISNKQSLDSEKINLLNIAQKLKNGAEYLEEVILEINDEIQIKPLAIPIKTFFYELISRYQNFNSSLELGIFLKTKYEKFEIDEELFLNTCMLEFKN